MYKSVNKQMEKILTTLFKKLNVWFSTTFILITHLVVSVVNQIKTNKQGFNINFHTTHRV